MQGAASFTSHHAPAAYEQHMLSHASVLQRTTAVRAQAVVHELRCSQAFMFFGGTTARFYMTDVELRQSPSISANDSGRIFLSQDVVVCYYQGDSGLESSESRSLKAQAGPLLDLWTISDIAAASAGVKLLKLVEIPPPSCVQVPHTTSSASLAMPLACRHASLPMNKPSIMPRLLAVPCILVCLGCFPYFCPDGTPSQPFMPGRKEGNLLILGSQQS